MDPVGAHYEVFRFEKNENPQNILLVYTRLTDSCEFILEGEDPLKPIFDFYWLMDKKDYKVVHPLIKSGIQDRLQVMIPANFPQNRNFFAVKVVDLEQINPSLSEILVEIRSRRTNKGCEVFSTFEAGADGKLILKSIYAESEKTFLPPFRHALLVRFDGVNEKTGKPEQRVYKAEKSK